MSNIVCDTLLNSRKLQNSVSLSLVKNLNGIDVLNVLSATAVVPGQAITVPRLLPNVVLAISKIADVVYRHIGGFGRIDGNDGQEMYVLEMPYGDETQIAVIAPRGDRLVVKACVYDGNKNYQPYQVAPDHQNGSLLLAAFYLFATVKMNAGIVVHLNSACSYLADKGLQSQDAASFARDCDLVGMMTKKMLTDETLLLSLLSDQGSAYRLFENGIKDGKYTPTKVLSGKFSFLTDNAGQIAVEKDQPIEKSNREWSEEEKQLIPTIEPWYVMPKEVGLICNLIQRSTNTFKPKRNFMLRGPSSTGKTSMARAIAATLGVPYVFITCSADTESYAFLGQPMYDTNGQVKYVESDFIRAIKNGWVVEVQEPYVIAKQGVLTALNGLLDDTGGITLPTGEFVKRHKDAIVIFTTNVSYVGCKKPNQSVLRRMNNVFDINLPSDKDIIARVEAVTTFGHPALLKKMVAAMHKINRYLQEQCISDGVCGVSELIDWVQTVQFTGSVLDSAESTIVSKATDDPEVQAGIVSTLASIIGEDEYQMTDEERISQATTL